MPSATTETKRRPPQLRFAPIEEDEVFESDQLDHPTSSPGLTPNSILEQQRRKLSELHNALPTLPPAPWSHLQDANGAFRRNSSVHFSRPFNLSLPSAWEDLRKPSTFVPEPTTSGPEEDPSFSVQPSGQRPSSPTLVSSSDIAMSSQDPRLHSLVLPAPSPSPPPSADGPIHFDFKFSPNIKQLPSRGNSNELGRKWSDFQEFPVSPPHSDGQDSDHSPPLLARSDFHNFAFDSSPSIPYSPVKFKSISIANPFAANPRSRPPMPAAPPEPNGLDLQQSMLSSPALSRASSFPYSEFLDSYADDEDARENEALAGHPSSDRPPSPSTRPETQQSWFVPSSAIPVRPQDDPAEFVRKRASTEYQRSLGHRSVSRNRSSVHPEDNPAEFVRRRKSSLYPSEIPTEFLRRRASSLSGSDGGGGIQHRKSSGFRGGNVPYLPRRRSSVYPDDGQNPFHYPGRRKSSYYPTPAVEDEWEDYDGDVPNEEQHRFMVDQYRDLISPYATPELRGDGPETPHERMVPAPLFWKPSFSSRSSGSTSERGLRSSNAGDRMSVTSNRSAEGLKISMGPKRLSARYSLNGQNYSTRRASRLSTSITLAAEDPTTPLPEVLVQPQLPVQPQTKSVVAPQGESKRWPSTLDSRQSSQAQPNTSRQNSKTLPNDSRRSSQAYPNTSRQNSQTLPDTSRHNSQTLPTASRRSSQALPNISSPASKARRIKNLIFNRSSESKSKQATEEPATQPLQHLNTAPAEFLPPTTFGKPSQEADKSAATAILKRMSDVSPHTTSVPTFRRNSSVEVPKIPISKMRKISDASPKTPTASALRRKSSERSPKTVSFSVFRRKSSLDSSSPAPESPLRSINSQIPQSISVPVYRPASPPSPKSTPLPTYRPESPPSPRSLPTTSFRAESPHSPRSVPKATFRSDSPPSPKSLPITNVRPKSPESPMSLPKAAFRTESPPSPRSQPALIQRPESPHSPHSLPMPTFRRSSIKETPPKPQVLTSAMYKNRDSAKSPKSSLTSAFRRRSSRESPKSKSVAGFQRFSKSSATSSNISPGASPRQSHSVTFADLDFVHDDSASRSMKMSAPTVNGQSKTRDSGAASESSSSIPIMAGRRPSSVPSLMSANYGVSSPTSNPRRSTRKVTHKSKPSLDTISDTPTTPWPAPAPATFPTFVPAPPPRQASPPVEKFPGMVHEHPALAALALGAHVPKDKEREREKAREKEKSKSRVHLPAIMGGLHALGRDKEKDVEKDKEKEKRKDKSKGQERRRDELRGKIRVVGMADPREVDTREGRSPQSIPKEANERKPGLSKGLKDVKPMVNGSDAKEGRPWSGKDLRESRPANTKELMDGRPPPVDRQIYASEHGRLGPVDRLMYENGRTSRGEGSSRGTSSQGASSIRSGGSRSMENHGDSGNRISTREEIARLKALERARERAREDRERNRERDRERHMEHERQREINEKERERQKVARQAAQVPGKGKGKALAPNGLKDVKKMGGGSQLNGAWI